MSLQSGAASQFVEQRFDPPLDLVADRTNRFGVPPVGVLESPIAAAR